MVLLLSLIPSSLKSSSLSESIGIIFVDRDGGYIVLRKQIETDCDTWWEENIEIVENNFDPKPYQSWVAHVYKGVPVIGHICGY